MATNVTTTTNYKGEVAGGIFRQIFLQSDSIESGLVTLQGGIKSEVAYLREATLANGIVDYQCGFSPSGDIDFPEKIVNLKKLSLPVEICKEEFRSTWGARNMSDSAWNVGLDPQEYREAIIDMMMGTVAEATEKSIWNGVEGAGDFQGVLTEMATDAKINKIASAVPITPANVIEQLTAVLAATPIKVKQHKDFVIVVDVVTAEALAVAYMNSNFAKDPNTFLHYTINKVNGLEASTILTYIKGNIQFLTGLASDRNEVKVEDKEFEGQYRAMMVWLAGASYVNASDITLYQGV